MEYDKVVALLVWIAEHMEHESAFLSPVPAWSVPAVDLLDLIGATWGLTREAVDVNPVREQVEARRG